jgi:hypothetical protein
VVSQGLDEPFSLFRQFDPLPGHERLELIVGPGDLPMPRAPLAARKLAIDPKPFIGNDLRYFFGVGGRAGRFVQMAFGMVLQLSQELIDPPDVRNLDALVWNSEQRRAGDDQISWCRPSKKSRNQKIGELIVLGAADSVDEKIAEQEPCEHGGHQRARPKRDALVGQFAELSHGRGGIAVWFEGQVGFEGVQVADDRAAPFALHEQRSPVRGLRGPYPERQLERIVCAG